MSPRFPDSKRASIAAVVLTGLALAVVFPIRPGGFESQGGWFLGLLPAVLLAYPLLDYVDRVAPRADSIAFWTLLAASLNFLWYWIVSYAAIKIWRFLED